MPQSSITQHPPCQLYPLSSHFCLSHLFSACNNNNNNNDTTAQQVIGRIEQFRCNNVVVILTKCYIFGRPAWPCTPSFFPWGQTVCSSTTSEASTTLFKAATFSDTFFGVSGLMTTLYMLCLFKALLSVLCPVQATFHGPTVFVSKRIQITSFVNDFLR